MVPVILTILSVVLMLIDCVSGASVFRWVNLARGYFFALRSFHLVNKKKLRLVHFKILRWKLIIHTIFYATNKATKQLAGRTTYNVFTHEI